EAEAVRLLDEALHAVGSVDSAARARLLGLRAEHVILNGGADGYAASLTQSATDAETALAMARRVGDPATLAFVLNEWQHARRAVAGVAPAALREERLAAATELLTLAEAAGDGYLALKG